MKIAGALTNYATMLGHGTGFCFCTFWRYLYALTAHCKKRLNLQDGTIWEELL